jgi:hypothetical protein
MARVKVSPKDPNATHQLSLSDGTRTFGIKAAGGPLGVQETPQTPSNIRITGGGAKYGDFDPMMSHLEQRTWEGGRAAEEYWQHETQFFDSMNCYTLIPDRAIPSPQWVFGEGLVYANSQLPGAGRVQADNDVHWMALTSTNLHAVSFMSDAASTYAMDVVQAWIRRMGTPPAQLTVGAHASDGQDDPGAVKGTDTLASTSIPEGVSVLHEFNMTTAAGSTMGTGGGADYFVQFNSTTAGTKNHHWEIGYALSSAIGSTSVYSDDTGTSWSTRSDVWPYFRTVGEAVDRKWRFFNMESALYAVDERADGSSSVLFINGDRGKAKGSSAGSTALLIDTTKSWSTAVYANEGAWVKFTKGPGVGQKSLITVSASQSLAISVPIAPTSNTEYIIYATDEWTSVSHGSTAWTDGVVCDVAVANNIAFFALGESTKIGEIRWASSIHEAYKSSTTANKLHTFYDPIDGAQLWRATSSNMRVGRANIPAFGSTIRFSSGVSIGDASYQITEIADYNDQLYVFKEDSLWAVKNNRAARLNVGLEAMPSSNNGAVWAAQDFFLFFPWAYSLERLYSGTLDDIGPWKGAGLPSGRQGVVSALEPVIAWMFAGIDAGSTGTSSVLVWNDRGWHEVFRAWDTGKRVEGIKWQPCPGTQDRLWISVGGELVSLKFPKDSLNPLNDSKMNYQHEAHIETGTFDMGVSELPKLFDEISLITQNLNSSGNEIYIEYQLDDDIGGSTWVSLGRVMISPSYALSINEGDVHKIRLRFRMLTSDADNPVQILASILKGVARTPIKRLWTMRAETGTFQVTAGGLPDHAPDDFYDWFQEAALKTRPLRMRSIWKSMDDIEVYAEPAVVQRLYTTPDGSWGGVLSISLREV